MGKIKQLIWILLFIMILFDVCAITDSETNNNNKTIYVDVYDTRDFEIVFVPIDNMHDYVKYTNQMAEFIASTFPLDNNALQNMYGWDPNKKCCPVSSEKYTNERKLKKFLEYLEESVKLHEYITPERIIGVLRKDWFIDNYNKQQLGRTLPEINYSTVIVERGYRFVAAHELGNTYGLCDEYDKDEYLNDLNRNGCGNLYSYFDEDECVPYGCPTDTYRELIPWGEDLFLHNFMGNADQYVEDTKHWINKESYEHLLNLFKDGTPINVSSRILINGISNKTANIIEFDNFYLLEEGFAENASEYNSGNYSIVLFDDVNTVLVNLTFDITYIESYEGAGDENISYFVYVLEFPENTSKIIITENGITKDEVNVSPNAPTVDLTYPDSSEIFEEPFNITWNANDPDGDTLYYAISLSYDNGSSYSTVELDYEDTYYTIDPNNFLCGSNYKAEVMVTDGVRTNTSQTFYNFSLVPDPSVDVDEIDVIYMDDTRVVFEITAINDGCDPVSNLSWAFDLGDGTEINSNYQVSLQYDEKILVYFEYEYQLGGQKSVNFSITNGSISDYLEYSFEIPNINITNYSIIYSNRSAIVLEYIIKNELPYQMGNVSWEINTGQNNIASIYNITLESGEDILVFIQENYNNYGTYTITFNASDGINNKTASLVYDYREIDVYNLTTLYQNSTTKEGIFEFSIRSLEDLNKNVSWKFDTGEIWLNSTINSTVNTTESVMVFIKYDYNQTGAYETTAQGLTNISNDTASTIVII